jgi:hypothetical protein
MEMAVGEGVCLLPFWRCVCGGVVALRVIGWSPVSFKRPVLFFPISHAAPETDSEQRALCSIAQLTSFIFSPLSVIPELFISKPLLSVCRKLNLALLKKLLY